VDVVVQDFGTWREIPADPGFRGRGLMLMRRLAEDVRVEPTPGGGTTVRFRVAVRMHLPAEGDAAWRSTPDSSRRRTRPASGRRRRPVR
jgi:hypothetical protein